MVSHHNAHHRYFRFLSATTVFCVALIGNSIASSTISANAEPLLTNTRMQSLSDIVSESPHANQIKLLTGDTVFLKDAQVIAVMPSPRPDNSIPHFSTFTVHGQVYVIPSDVRTLLNNGLDQELFNVSRLVSYGMAESSNIPIIVETTGTKNSSASTELDLGMEPVHKLTTMSIQAGRVETDAASGPAQSWSLLNALSASIAESESSSEAVPTIQSIWLDRQHRVNALERISASDGSEIPPWMNLIGVSEAHDMGWKGVGVQIAVVDSGIDEAHPDLVGQVVARKDFTGSGSTYDESGHGTFVASEIAGTGVASNGVYAGVAPSAKLINARVLDMNGTGMDSDIMAGIEWAAQQGADIINISLGDSGQYDDGSTFFDQFLDSVAEEYDCLIVVAAGNDGMSQSISVPATADEALSVGATLQDGSLAWFSSTGPRRGNGAVNPQIMAPGAGEIVIGDDGEQLPGFGGPQTTGIIGAGANTSGYVSDGWLGTSMAAPLVSGAAALVKESDPSLSRSGLRAKLMASAQPLPDTSNVFQQGSGLLSVPTAISQTLTTSPAQVNMGKVSAPYPNSVSQELTYINTSDSDQVLVLKAALTYTEDLEAPTEVDQYFTTTRIGSKMLDMNIADTKENDYAWNSLDSDDISLSTSTLTIPAGGTSSVNVVIDAAAFPAGYIGGYVMAETPEGTFIRTPIGMANSPEPYDISITATDVDGYPLDASDVYSDLTIINLDSGEMSNVPISNGNARMTLDSSQYLIVGDSIKTTSDGGISETVLLSPPIQVSDSPSVVLDGREAKPVIVQTDRPTEGMVVGQVTFTDIDGTNPFSSQMYGGSSDAVSSYSLNVTPVLNTSQGGWTFDAAATLTQPYLEAAIDECGEEKVPMIEIGDALPAGNSNLRVTDGLDSSSQNSSRAALLRWDKPNLLDPNIDIVLDWIESAEAKGYSALIINSDGPSIAKMAIQATLFNTYLIKSPSPQLPIFLTTLETGDRIRERIHAGADSLYVLKKDTPGYVYGLISGFDLGRSSSLVITGNDDTTFRVPIVHRSMGSMTHAEDTFNGDRPVNGGSVSVGVPSAYDAYLTADRVWSVEFSLSASTGDNPMTVVTTSTTDFTSGSKSIEFGSQVHSVGLDPSPMLAITREGNELFGGVPWFVDGQGNLEVTRDSTNYPDYAAVDLSITDITTGEQMLSIHDDPLTSLIDVTDLPPELHTYQMKETTISHTSAWALSTTVASTWTWKSKKRDSTTGQNGLEPLFQMGYELPNLDSYNNGSTKQTIILHVSQQPDSEVKTIDSVLLQVSLDKGTTWSTLPIKPLVGGYDTSNGESLYSSTIETPEGSSISITSSVFGGDSSFEQTIIDAYHATSSPRPFPPATVWKTCGSLLVINGSSVISSSPPIAIQTGGSTQR